MEYKINRDNKNIDMYDNKKIGSLTISNQLNISKTTVLRILKAVCETAI